MSDVIVLFNPEHQKFEATISDEVVGVLAYEMNADVMSLVTTEVDPHYGGRGIGGALVKFAFETARKSGDTRIQPVCPFVVAWANKHPEYADIVVAPPEQSPTDD